MPDNLQNLILQKLEKIDVKQDAIEAGANERSLAMVRMEERQVQIHAALAKGAGVMEDHGRRLTSLEKNS